MAKKKKSSTIPSMMDPAAISTAAAAANGLSTEASLHKLWEFVVRQAESLHEMGQHLQNESRQPASSSSQAASGPTMSSTNPSSSGDVRDFEVTINSILSRCTSLEQRTSSLDQTSFELPKRLRILEETINSLQRTNTENTQEIIELRQKLADAHKINTDTREKVQKLMVLELRHRAQASVRRPTDGAPSAMHQAASTSSVTVPQPSLLNPAPPADEGQSKADEARASPSSAPATHAAQQPSASTSEGPVQILSRASQTVAAPSLSSFTPSAPCASGHTKTAPTSPSAAPHLSSSDSSNIEAMTGQSAGQWSIPSAMRVPVVGSTVNSCPHTGATQSAAPGNGAQASGVQDSQQVADSSGNSRRALTSSNRLDTSSNSIPSQRRPATSSLYTSVSKSQGTHSAHSGVGVQGHNSATSTAELPLPSAMPPRSIEAAVREPQTLLSPPSVRSAASTSTAVSNSHTVPSCTVPAPTPPATSASVAPSAPLPAPVRPTQYARVKPEPLDVDEEEITFVSATNSTKKGRAAQAALRVKPEVHAQVPPTNRTTHGPPNQCAVSSMSTSAAILHDELGALCPASHVNVSQQDSASAAHRVPQPVSVAGASSPTSLVSQPSGAPGGQQSPVDQASARAAMPTLPQAAPLAAPQEQRALASRLGIVSFDDSAFVAPSASPSGTRTTQVNTGQGVQGEASAISAVAKGKERIPLAKNRESDRLANVSSATSAQNALRPKTPTGPSPSVTPCAIRARSDVQISTLPPSAQASARLAKRNPGVLWANALIRGSIWRVGFDPKMSTEGRIGHRAACAIDTGLPSDLPRGSRGVTLTLKFADFERLDTLRGASTAALKVNFIVDLNMDPQLILLGFRHKQRLIIANGGKLFNLQTAQNITVPFADPYAGVPILEGDMQPPKMAPATGEHLHQDSLGGLNNTSNPSWSSRNASVHSSTRDLDAQLDRYNGARGRGHQEDHVERPEPWSPSSHRPGRINDLPIAPSAQAYAMPSASQTRRSRQPEQMRLSVLGTGDPGSYHPVQGLAPPSSTFAQDAADEYQIGIAFGPTDDQLQSPGNTEASESNTVSSRGAIDERQSKAAASSRPRTSSPVINKRAAAAGPLSGRIFDAPLPTLEGRMAHSTSRWDQQEPSKRRKVTNE
ncbi:hypothetical protein IE81DRAFT_342490 [Ceraceosorus guamensis]|uniref:Uncharacterized protein n=1 Tax=Ceraceosorus guamensis TaxID=1522189 RepID=A0A316VTA8_9BASI|nr:hypothetical protein IE81DRAFT_342490 [Ceraceosorus guamensis]PWN40826.1 hypothetical protein IE81DRAFT_342490 [Ceraceosorus guamensis]